MINPYNFLTNGRSFSSPSSTEKELEIADHIVLTDPNLKAEIVPSGLNFPTKLAFLRPGDFIILEKNTGLIKSC
ncbi:MAG: hypothetical protein ACPKPY_13350 [Nitrososphaeraceae archaeon]